MAAAVERLARDDCPLGSSAVDPRGGGTGLQRVPDLREQRPSDAGQDVAAAGGSEYWIARRADEGRPARREDDRRNALEQDRCTGDLREHRPDLEAISED